MTTIQDPSEETSAAHTVHDNTADDLEPSRIPPSPVRLIRVPPRHDPGPEVEYELPEIELPTPVDDVAELETLLDTLSRLGTDGLWDWDLSSGDVRYSPRFVAMLGLEPVSLGHHIDDWFDRIHPDDFGGFNAQIVACIDGQQLEFDYEFRVLQRDGTYRWMSCRGEAGLNAVGRVARLTGVVTDITDRKRLEHRRVNRRELERNATRMSLDPIACVASQGLLELVESNLDTALLLREGCRYGLDAEACERLKQLVDGNRQVRGLVRWLLYGLLS